MKKKQGIESMSGLHYEHDPLLDEDEALDYILYEDMEQESEQQPGKGCLAGALLFLLVPGSVGLLMYML
ncbi:hypothetical protein [Desulfobulbus alkaliphilus]|uniref:hypothetical protein n=1 Tax=Desulfobulbus alkaliphilus TaxID=869814 RepID=UPI00196521BE|nr:hypothetical protein [Desulfobulbus alkaliphilus]MBM9536307.1 hypothetical protein [Desulfobulbus alkaliphilus]